MAEPAAGHTRWVTVTRSRSSWVPSGRAPLVPDPAPAAWFLAAGERGNDATSLDRAPTWSSGNTVTVHIDGSDYLPRLAAVLRAAHRPDQIMFTDGEGDRDERLAGTRLDALLLAAVRRGVMVRGLLWRSHPRQAHFAEQDNAAFARELNDEGAEVLLDERVRRAGSHHQKLVVVDRSLDHGGPVAFVGGIDLCHGRNDDRAHLGDPQPVALDARYGSRPPWHDAQAEIRGPAVADLVETFRERWDDPTRLDHRNPLRALGRRWVHQPAAPEAPLPPFPRPAGSGTDAVQVLRTYPAKRPSFPFAPEGERSIARAYLKAFGRARSLVYLEDQYLWSAGAAAALAAALRRAPELRVIVVVPRYPDRDGRLTGAVSHLARARCMRLLRRAGGDRVAVYDIENARGVPIYVHAKVCIVDDVWMTVGSDNVNVRSWTHDSELSCAIIGSTRDTRRPVDPAGLGDGARAVARSTRLRLACEHLGRHPEDTTGLVDPTEAFATFATAAADLDRWYDDGARGPRPAGRLRRHRPEHVPTWLRVPARLAMRFVVDPDGRPRALRNAGAY
jgi:phosphatidylserine/phosphatidylglycerophosphate/cardiolipin synthase-like enzyme